MAKIKINQNNRLVVEFSEREFSGQMIVATAVRHRKRIFVNWGLPLLTWDAHDIRCVEDILDAIRKVGNWQSKLQGQNVRWGAHAHKPTILRNNGLSDQKVRYPVFAKQSEPYVQWKRDDEGSEWLVQGYFFNDDLPSAAAYYAALRNLKDRFVEINRNLGGG